MNAVKPAANPRDELATTWSRYVEALDRWRTHRTESTADVQRRLNEAIEQGRKLQRTAQALRNQR